MSGRIVNVKPKPGFAMDHSGHITATNDNLRNAMTGMGTHRDTRVHNAYAAPFLTQQAIITAYRGSGLLRKIIQIPALDMVREWREWKLEADDVTLIEAEEKRHAIRRKVREVEILRGLGGGALILGLPGDPQEPAPETGKGELAFIHIVSRWQLQFSELDMDPFSPFYGEPVEWTMHQHGGTPLRIHPSRVVPFRADTTALPVMGSVGSGADAYWGESTVAQVLDAVTDCDAARSSFAALVNKARTLRVGIPGLMEMVANGKQADIQARLDILNQAEGIHNAVIYDAGRDGKDGEVITDSAYSFAGAKDIIDAFKSFVAAVSDIPATRMFGQSASGLNASGDSEQRDWAKNIKARQEIELSACLDRLDAYLIPSALGKVPDGAWYEWASLDIPTERETADRMKVLGDLAKIISDLNAVPEPAFNRAVQSWLVNEGVFPELEQALAEIPDDERYGLETGEPDGPDMGEPDEADPAAVRDAKPIPLYVRRDLLNAAELMEWAKDNGLEPIEDMHVTILYSRTAVDPIEMGGSDWSDSDGGLVIKAGGPRALERFGEGAVVLQFASHQLQYRHDDMVQRGASHDFPRYLPHVTITYSAPDGVDIDALKPFTGELRFGPEIFEPLNPEWKPRTKGA